MSRVSENVVHTEGREGAAEFGKPRGGSAPRIRIFQNGVPFNSINNGNLQPRRHSFQVPAPFHHRIRDPQEL